jgi:hypothetical protein
MQNEGKSKKKNLNEKKYNEKEKTGVKKES